MPNISKQLKELFKKLQLMEVDEYGKDIYNGVVAKENFASVFSFDNTERLKEIQVDWVYHFDKEPLVLFFDLDKNDKRNIEIIKKQSYNFDKPVIFILEFGKPLAIFNAFSYSKKTGKFDLDKIDAEKVDTETNEKYIDKFSFWKLQSGDTWEWFDKIFFNKSKNRVHTELLNNIKNLRKSLSNIKNIDILILRLIFIRYLIDRGVKIRNLLIDGGKNDRKRLAAIIRNPKELEEAFDYLKKHFNGNLFEQKINFEKSVLNQFSELFAGKIDDKGNAQLALFDIFDFSIIPIETISGIYEEIISDDKKKDNSAVYTPLFLVNHILDKTINNNYFEKYGTNCKILDPACGSGIFLVQAFRRMIHWEKDYGDKNITRSISKLNKLVEENIFGIDKDKTALNVAVFSLYIAILDFKTPKEISESKQQLPELIGKNLFEADFFNDEDKFNHRFGNKQYKSSLFPNPQDSFPADIKSVALDFIIGNPPWSNETGVFHSAYMKSVENEVKISGNQIAQSFLWHAKDFVNENKTTQIAFIVTSTAFYNLAAKDFRTKFFKNFAIKWLFDMSAARRLAFEGRTDNPAMILSYQYAQNEVKCSENILQYEALKPNIFIKIFRQIVIDVARTVKQSFLIENNFMLKVLLYGDILDFYFLKRITKNINTIEKVLKNNTDVYYGDGIKLLTKNAIEKIKQTYKDASNAEILTPFNEIKNIPVIEGEELQLYFSKINPKNLPQERESTKNKEQKTNDLYVKSGRNTNLYLGERILLRGRPKDESTVFVSYIDTSCVYREKTLGISSINNTNFLKNIYAIFVSNLYNYFQYLHSAMWGVALPDTRQEEFLNFPYIETKQQTQLIELANELIEHHKEQQETFFAEKKSDAKILEQINQLINETYQISPTEKDLIDYVLDVARYEFQEGKIKDFVTKKLNISNEKDKIYLKNYAQIFYNHFGQVYNGAGEYFQIKIFVFEYFIAMQFAIVTEKPTKENQIIFDESNKDIKSLLTILASNLSIYEVSENVFLQQNLKGFEDDFFYIIKPNQLKSWHRAKAHTDLSYFIDEIDKAELKLYGDS